jgi:predicted protein tyrosine phosphatase
MCTAKEDRSPTAVNVMDELSYGRILSKAISVDELIAMGDPPSKTKIDYLRSYDRIFVMTSGLKDYIHPDYDVLDRVVVLGIPDSYSFMEPDLVKVLKEKLREYV